MADGAAAIFEQVHMPARQLVAWLIWLSGLFLVVPFAFVMAGGWLWYSVLICAAQALLQGGFAIGHYPNTAWWLPNPRFEDEVDRIMVWWHDHGTASPPAPLRAPEPRAR